MSNIVQIPGARVPVINLETGIMNPVWYRFFELLNAEARSSSNPTLVLGAYTNNAAAVTGGLVPGQMYQASPALDPQPIYIVKA